MWCSGFRALMDPTAPPRVPTSLTRYLRCSPAIKFGAGRHIVHTEAFDPRLPFRGIAIEVAQHQQYNVRHVASGKMAGYAHLHPCCFCMQNHTLIRTCTPIAADSVHTVLRLLHFHRREAARRRFLLLHVSVVARPKTVDPSAVPLPLLIRSLRILADRTPNDCPPDTRPCWTFRLPKRCRCSVDGTFRRAPMV
ncbi:hypothetical protein M011DRAFT_242858 [Sporormia fimetaria CBS 119925]|uniref:Uncharacterized protein n=1 Tax=Sporormia fimetaria CBS 119925 TaxID=1340428 RepID=A0A6A6VJY5_9PLEO|nr:hypothetical protein M011DRAFT_242858 [Sporormia fimetaria CBS 119925]